MGRGGPGLQSEFTWMQGPQDRCHVSPGAFEFKEMGLEGQGSVQAWCYWGLLGGIKGALSINA